MALASGNGVSPVLARVGSGVVRHGRARRGWARPGEAWATDGGTEGFGLPCRPLRGWTWLGGARRGWAGHGLARRGVARQGKG